MKYPCQVIDHYGIIATYCKDLDLIGIIDNILPKKKRKVTVGEATLAMILNAMGFVTQPLYLTPSFFEKLPIDLLIRDGLQSEDFNDDSLGRALDLLYEYGLSALFTIVATKVLEHLGIKPSVGHLDTTSFSFQGEYPDQTDESEVQITHGYSKDHRPDLKQMLVALICEAKTGIPIHFETISGNTQDKASFLPIINRFQNQLETSKLPSLIQADSALYTADNIKALNESCFFLTRVPHGLKKVKSIISSAVLEKMEVSKTDERYHYQWYESTYGEVEQNWLLVHSAPLAKSTGKTLDKNIKKAEKQAIEKIKKHGKQKFSCEADARSSLKKLGKKLKYHTIDAPKITITKKYHNSGRPIKEATYDEIFQITSEIIPDQEAINSALHKKGFFVLATNQKRDSLIAEDLISTYKNQNTTVEKGFRFLKDSKFFTDAMFLHKPERIEAMLMIMSLSLLFYSSIEYMFQKKVKESGEKLPNQVGKKVSRISLRWLFALFQRIFILNSIENNLVVKKVLYLEDYHRKALAILGTSYEKMYLSTG